jgi:hypothetical protein
MTDNIWSPMQPSPCTRQKKRTTTKNKQCALLLVPRAPYKGKSERNEDIYIYNKKKEEEEERGAFRSCPGEGKRKDVGQIE